MQGLRLFPLRRNGFRCFSFEQPGAYLTNPARKNSRFFTFRWCIFSKTIDKSSALCYSFYVPQRNMPFGGIAQLGERLTGSQEVSGSIPLISTKKHLLEAGAFFCTEERFHKSLLRAAHFQGAANMGVER